MNRRGVTLVELAVVLMILLTLVGLLAPAFLAATASPNAEEEVRREPQRSWNLYTAQHDGHWFVKDAGGGVCHHPDCPCRSMTAERGEE
jgi:prepilin-type N-terminal cleavage/methylation domain-containing protein